MFRAAWSTSTCAVGSERVHVTPDSAVSPAPILTIGASTVPSFALLLVKDSIAPSCPTKLSRTRGWFRYSVSTGPPAKRSRPSSSATERAVELAAYVSSEPGPGGEPLYEWIDVREVMSEAPSDD